MRPSGDASHPRVRDARAFARASRASPDGPQGHPRCVFGVWPGVRAGAPPPNSSNRRGDRLRARREQSAHSISDDPHQPWHPAESCGRSSAPGIPDREARRGRRSIERECARDAAEDVRRAPRRAREDGAGAALTLALSRSEALATFRPDELGPRTQPIQVRGVAVGAVALAPRRLLENPERLEQRDALRRGRLGRLEQLDERRERRALRDEDPLAIAGDEPINSGPPGGAPRRRT
jgi:hypothetical protein